MENPFEILLEKLNRIEKLIQGLTVNTFQEVSQPATERKWMNVQQVAIIYLYQLLIFTN
ncbi:MAG: hypothetical protein IPN14_08335 [Bacteroidetes bacterium]|nr:hypothetical protein [Bacteroidota bacterium]